MFLLGPSKYASENFSCDTKLNFMRIRRDFLEITIHEYHKTHILLILL
jgi:hypothetical protein